MKAILVLVVIYAIASCYSCAQEDTFAGHKYNAVLKPNGITWDEAKSEAAAAGGYLVTITSREENDFVFNLVSANNAFWKMESWGSGTGPWIGLYKSGNRLEVG